MTRRTVLLVVLTIALAGVNSAAEEPVSKHGFEYARGLVEIEMQIRNMTEGSWIGNKQNQYDYSKGIYRFELAGSKIIPEFSKALESDERGDRYLAGSAMKHLSAKPGWEGIFDFAITRLKRKPGSPEAAMLIYGICNEKVEKYSELASLVAPYLEDRTYIINISRTSSRTHESQEIQTRHCACLVLQFISKVDFGATAANIKDESIEKAITWVKSQKF